MKEWSNVLSQSLLNIGGRGHHSVQTICSFPPEIYIKLDHIWLLMIPLRKSNLGEKSI